MKFSYGWIRELVPGLATDPLDLERLITMKTAECEGVEPVEGARDWIIEIDNKSLTHRPDLWGHYGMAREVAAITKNKLLDPVDLTLLPATGEPEIKVEIADYAFCSRYSALAFENASVASSPIGLQSRLESVGLSSINGIVDVTNYVLAELPQPMHAFDRDKLSGATIFVRLARRGEQLRALNGETYELSESDLVIADAAGPVALAGVIGGADSAISETTRRIVLESANFQAASIRSTSARHKIRTDASMRFEKSLDPENTLRGLARAISLLREVCPDIRVSGGVTDARGEVAREKLIELPLSFVVRKLGMPLHEEQVSEILRALGFGVMQSAPAVLTVTVPTWRATKDVGLKDDLVEEVGRMIGYGEIVPVAPLVQCVPPPSNPMRAYLRRVRRDFAGQGFSEAQNYSFLTAADAERFQLSLGDHIGVRNPVASELTHLRRSLIPGLYKNVLGNARRYAEVRLFEIGSEIHPVPGAQLPREITHAAAVLYEAQSDEETFFEMKRVSECVFPQARFSAAAETNAYEHPARTAEIHWRGVHVGRLFELHPSLLVQEGLEGKAVFLDADLSACLEVARQETKYSPLRRYPTSGFDVSAVAEARTPVGVIEERLSALAGSNLASIDFVRQYAGPPLPEGYKSVSYHLELGALDHTLTSAEGTALREEIVQGMRDSGFEIRGLD